MQSMPFKVSSTLTGSFFFVPRNYTENRLRPRILEVTRFFLPPSFFLRGIFLREVSRDRLSLSSALDGLRRLSSRMTLAPTSHPFSSESNSTAMYLVEVFYKLTSQNTPCTISLVIPFLRSTLLPSSQWTGFLAIRNIRLAGVQSLYVI